MSNEGEENPSGAEQEHTLREISEQSIQTAADALGIEVNDLIERLGSSQAEQQNHQQLAISRSFSGPLPHPELLELYERVQPGFAERIMAMTEAETKHIRDIEQKALCATRWEVHLGQVFALIIGLAAIVGGVYASVNGAEWAGGFLGTGGVFGLVSVFIMGRSRANRKE